MPERGRIRGDPDGLQHLGEVSEDEVIRETKDSVARQCKQGFSFGITIPLRFVDRAIELDGQTGLGTTEVDDERPNWVLTAKLQSRQPTTAQLGPETIFGCRFSRT